MVQWGHSWYKLINLISWKANLFCHQVYRSSRYRLQSFMNFAMMGTRLLLLLVVAAASTSYPSPPNRTPTYVKSTPSFLGLSVALDRQVEGPSNLLGLARSKRDSFCEEYKKKGVDRAICKSFVAKGCLDDAGSKNCQKLEGKFRKKTGGWSLLSRSKKDSFCEEY